MSRTSETGEKCALFIGRWQPLHNGHDFIIRKKLDEGVPVVIAVRDTPVNDHDPYTAEERVRMIEHCYAGENVRVIVIPDIEGVYIGRKVGYKVERFDVPQEIGGISATEIRTKMAKDDDSWEDNVPKRIAEFLKS